MEAYVSAIELKGCETDLFRQGGQDKKRRRLRWATNADEETDAPVALANNGGLLLWSPAGGGVEAVLALIVVRGSVEPIDMTTKWNK